MEASNPLPYGIDLQEVAFLASADILQAEKHALLADEKKKQDFFALLGDKNVKKGDAMLKSFNPDQFLNDQERKMAALEIFSLQYAGWWMMAIAVPQGSKNRNQIISRFQQYVPGFVDPE